MRANWPCLSISILLAGLAGCTTATLPKRYICQRAADPHADGAAHPAGQIAVGFRPGHLGRRPGSDNLSAVFPGSRADIHQIIRRFHHLQIVLDHQNRVAQVAQTAQDGNQTLGIALVQTDAFLTVSQ